LEEELALVAKPGAHIIAIGQDVRSFMARHMGHIEVRQLLHYSPLAASARNSAIRGKEEEFKSFSGALEMEQILALATKVLHENSVPQALATMTLDRLHKVPLTESRKKLAFVYAETLQRLSKG
jgi:hypothetical protein